MHSAVAETLESRLLMASTHLSFGTQPSDTVAGDGIASITVSVLDGSNNVVIGDHSFVTLKVATGPGSSAGELLFAVQAVNGVATFSGLSLTDAGTYTLRATDGLLTAAISGSFAITPDVASQLAITAEPSTSTAGATLANFTVVVEDQFGNVVASDNSNISISLNGNTTLGGTLTVAANSGVASFSDLVITKSGNYTISASDGGLTVVTSDALSISAATATHLVFSTAPAGTTAGTTLAGVTVSIEDQYNNVVTSDGSTVTLALASGNATLGGTLTAAAVNGVATFGDLALTKAGAYTLGVSDGGLSTATSGSFTIAPATATQLVFTQQSGNVSAGALGTYALSIEDAFGNVLTSSSASVTISLGSGNGTLLGTTTINASNGVATFSDLAIHTPGTFSLTAVSGSLTNAVSGTFSVTAATASQVVFSTTMSNINAGNLSNVVATIEDQYGNTVASDSSNVTLSISGNGTLGGTLTIAATNGVATFSDLNVHTPGTFTLSAADGALTAATSNSFTVSPASATHLVFTNSPGNVAAGLLGSVSVSVEDQFGNVVTSDNSMVAISVASGNATLLGTLTAQTVNGVATFSNLAIHIPGTFTLSAVDGDLSSATTGNFTVTPATAAKVVFNSQPTSTVAGDTLSAFSAAIEDQFGNIVTTSTANIRFAVTTNGQTLNLIVAASNGVATLSGIALVKAGSASIRATSTGLTAANSNTFMVTPADAFQLVVTQQLSTAVAGVTFSTIQVAVEDQYENIVTTDSSNVSLVLDSGNSDINGATTVAVVNGVATFTTLSTNKVGSFSTHVMDGDLVAASLSDFTITPAAASQLVFTQETSGGVAGATLSTVKVSVEDQFGNVVTTNSSNVTLSIPGNPAVSGTLTEAAVNGVATFSDLSLTQTGLYMLGAADGGLTGTFSSILTITPDAATHLAYMSSPSNMNAGNVSGFSVAVEDQFNNIVTTDSSNVTIALASGNGSLGGTLTVAAVDGVATFSTLSLHTADTDTLSVADGVLTDATTSNFIVSPAAASHLVFTNQPGNGTVGSLNTIAVAVEDQYGNVVTTDTSTVTLSLNGDGNFTGNITQSVSNGVALFTNMSLTTAGNFTLSASDGQLTIGTSDPFVMSPDVATHLVFGTSPGTSLAGTLGTITVLVEDQYGNVVTTDSSTVTMSDNGPGSLGGTLTADAVNGVATFTNLQLHRTGFHELTAAESGLTSVTSEGFGVRAAAASQLVVTRQPGNAVAGETFSAIDVTVEDQYGNQVVLDSHSNVTVSYATSAGAPAGTLTVAVQFGVATFSDLSETKAGTSYELSFLDGALSSGTSTTFDVTAAAPSHVAFTSLPSDIAAGGTFSDFTVAVEDQFNNIVTTDTSAITISNETGTGTISGNVTVNAVNGIATFTGLSTTKAEILRLIANDDTLTSDVTLDLTVSPSAATQFVFVQTPVSVIAGTLGTITVAAEDQFGNVDPTYVGTVTISKASGPGSVSGTNFTNAVGGIATFTDVGLHTVGNYTLQASDGGLTDATSDNIQITPATATHVVFATGPASGTAGGLNTVIAEVEDQYGNVVTTDSSSITLSLNGLGNFTGNLTQTASNGVATFGDLRITISGSFTITASDGELTGATSGNFTISPDVAAKLVIGTAPVFGTVGTIDAVTVLVEDQYGNLETTDTSTVTMSHTGNGILGGTVTADAVGGVATFSNLQLHTVGLHQLTASEDGLTSVTSEQFGEHSAAATQLVITGQPGDVVAGRTISTVTVELEDQFGNQVVSNNSNVTISLASGNATLGGTLTVAAQQGLATFTDLSLTKSGNYTLGVADGNLSIDTSSSFAVTPAAATHLVFTSLPGNIMAGGTFADFTVAVEDQYGNVVDTDTSAVTISREAGQGSLSGNVTVHAVNGVATFTGLSTTKAEVLRLIANDDTLTSDVTFDLTVSPLAATQFVFVQTPVSVIAGTLGTITVAAEDQFGNVDPTYVGTVSISKASGTGSISGTNFTNAVDGIATFTDLDLDTVGNYTLQASDGGLTDATSDNIQITPATATHLVFTTPPANSVAGVLSQVSVAVEDEFDNIVTDSVSSNITLSLGTGSGSFSGDVTVTTSNGVAVFSNLHLTTTGNFTLHAADGALTFADSANFTVSADIATQLVFTTPPTSTTVGTLGTVVVSVEDQFGNVVTDDNVSTVTITKSGPGALDGTDSATVTNGLATFTDLELHTSGNYTLSSADGNLTTSSTDSFTMTAGAATQLVVSQQPGHVVAGQTFGTITVNVEDVYGNVVTTDHSNVTVYYATSAGAPAGTIKVAAENGVATFSNLFENHAAASYELGFFDGGLSDGTSNTFDVTADTATHLVFTSQPGDITAGGTFASFTVAVEDQFGNVVTGDTSPVTIARTTGNGTLSGTLTADAINGVATFSGLSMTKANVVNLTASGSLLATDTTNNITVSPDVATDLVFISAPTGNVVAGTLGTIKVAVEDQFGNIVTTNASNVTIAVETGNGTLGGNMTVAAVDGVAIFSDLYIHDVDAFVLDATASGLSVADNNSFAIVPAAPTQVVILSGPGNSVAGALGSISFAIEDQFGNVVTADSPIVSVSIASGNGSLLGTTEIAATGGVGAFTNLSITTSGNYTLTLVDGDLNVTTGSFTIQPDVATHLVVTTQPGATTVAGVTMSNIVVSIEDQYGNVVDNDSSSVVLSLNGNGTLGGTLTVAATNGVARFADLSITKTGLYSVTASDSSLVTDTTNAFSITPDVATHVVYTANAGNTSAGNLSTVTVAIEDQFNNIVTTDTSAVTLSVATGPGSLLGNVTVNAVNGVATFTGLAIHKSGSYTITASDNSLTTATTGSFTIAPATASKVIFTTQPIGGTAGSTLSAVSISVEDQYGNVVTTNTSTISLLVNTGGSSFTLNTAATAGVSTFSGFSFTKSGNFTLTATDSGLTSSISNTFTITPDVATHLAFVIGPTNINAGNLTTMTVAVEDQFNNIVTSDSSNVTLAIASGNGTLGGTLTTGAVNGMATFSAASIHTPGAFTLNATDGALTQDTSGNFTVTPAAATHLVITQQPAGTSAGTLGTFTVAVEDQYGNVVTTDSSTVTLSDVGPGPLSGTRTAAAVNGVASFSAAMLTRAGNYTITLSDGSLTSATTDSFTITPAAADHLVVTTQPGNVAAGALGTITVTVKDQYNNIVTTDGSTVSLSLNGNATLGGTVSAAAVNGVATFSAATVTKSGNYTLTAADASLTGATTNSFAVTPAAADHLVMTASPNSTTAGALSTVTVAVEDQYNNIVTTDSSNVTIALNGNATLGGTLTVAAANGVATFSDLSLHTPGTYTLGATDSILTGGNSSSFTITPAAASQIVITQQPGNATAGALGTISLAVEDQYGNIVTTDASNLTIAINMGNGILTGTTSVNAGNGLASFSDLSITKSGNYTLIVSDGVLTSAITSTFAVSAGNATHLAYVTDPMSNHAGGLNPTRVAIEDQYNNIVRTDSSTVVLTLNGNSTLGGTLSAVVSNGIATFTDLSLHTVGLYTITAADGSLTQITSGNITITPTTADHLAIIGQPAGTSAGTLNTITVAVEDQYNNIVTTNASNVALSLNGNATLGGTVSTTAVNGVATFSAATITKAGNYTLTISDGSLTGATTDSFTISAAAATHVAITTQPGNSTAGTLGTIAVAVEDQYNNIVTTDSTTVTLSLNGNATLGGTVSAVATNGIATFSAATITKSGNYTLTLSDGSLTTATTDSFTISAAEATQLVITTQPGNSSAGTLGTITVAVEDQYNNVVTTDNSTVALSLNGNATLGGTVSTAAANGIAIFSATTITKAGNYTLTLSDGSLISTTTDSFTVTPAVANHLVVTGQPGNSTAGTLNTITVAIEDQYNNIVTTDGSTVALSLNGNATLGGTVNAVAANGIATFSAATITKTGNYTLTLSDGSLTSVTTDSFTVTPSAATHLVVTGQPGGSAAGTLNTITVAIEDQYNNIVITDGSTVALALNGNGTLAGTVSTSAVNGVATFSAATVTKSGNYTLSISDGSLTATTTNSLVITPAAANHLAIITQPGNATAGTLGTITIAIEDQYNNIVTTDASTIALSLNGNGTLGGNVSVTAANGVATFSAATITKAGNYTLTASDGSLTGATTTSFTVTPNQADHLVITGSPVNTIAGGLGTMTVAVEDQYGNIETDYRSTVTIALNGNATLGGSVSADVSSGIATFSNLFIHTSGSYTLTASANSLTSDSSNITIAAGAASQIEITSEPSSTTAGNLGNLSLAIEDQYGNVVTTDNGNVSLTLSGDVATLGGTKTLAAQHGLVTFSGLSVTKTGNYAINISTGNLTSATDSFAISHDVATTVVFTTQPGNQAAGTLGSISVSIEDQFGNIVTDETSSVTLGIASGNATLGGNVTVNTVNGTATFNGVTLTKAGNYTLSASDGSLDTDISSQFAISPGTAAKLVYLQAPASSAAGPLGTVTVAVEDQYNNIVTTNSSNVTVAISGNTGLGGTLTVPAINGIATFSNLVMTKSGAFTITATDGSLTSAISGNFNVAAKLAIIAQPTTAIAGTLGTITVAIQDASGNLLATDNSTVTLTLNTGLAGAGHSGDMTVNAVNGIATFNNVSIITAGNYTLTASDGTIATARTKTITVVAAAPTSMTFTQGPSIATAGSKFGPSIIVRLQDQYGNLATSYKTPVTLSAGTSPSGAQLSGTLTATPSNGIVTFSNVIAQKAGDYTLTATAGSVTETSGTISVSAAAAKNVVITTQPVTTSAGTSFSVVAKITDNFGNLVSNSFAHVTIDIASKSASGTVLHGTLTTTAANGVATFTGLSLTKTGNYTLSVNSPGLNGVNSVLFAITSAAPAQLVFTNQPKSAVAGASVGTTLTVAVRDQFGNLCNADSSSVTLGLNTSGATRVGSPANLAGALTVNAVNGIATFTGVSAHRVGSYVLTASGASLTAAASTAFTITPAAATSLQIIQQPTSVHAGVNIAPAITVKLFDQFGNLATTNKSTVRLAIATGTAGAKLSGSVTASVSGGIATFSSLKVSLAGQYTLLATDNTLATDTTAPFIIQ